MTPTNNINPLHTHLGPSVGVSIALFVTATGILRFFQSPEPLWLVAVRIIVVASCISHAMFYRDIKTKYQFHRNNITLLFPFHVWSFSLAWHSQFSPHHSLQILAVCILSTLIFSNESWLRLYASGITLLTGLFLLLVEQPGINPIIMFGSQGLSLFICTKITTGWIGDIKRSQAQNSLMTTIFEDSPDALILRAEDGSIRKVSAQVASLFLTDSIPRVTELVSHLDTSSDKSHQEGARQELKFTDANGGIFWGSFNFRSICYRQERLTLIRITNIAWRKTLEDNLYGALRRANSSLEVRRNFIANMSHELRTPMNGVIGMTSLLEHTDLSDTQMGYVNTIKSSGDLMLKVISDVLDFSSLDAGKIELDKTDEDIRVIAKQCCDLVAVEATLKQLSLTCTFSPSVPKTLRLDSQRVRQIVLNLLSNAVKFTQLGAVELSVNATRKSENKFKIEIAVSDTGVGIPKAKVKTIFKAFTQADPSTTRIYGGSGLGLSISSGLANLMGGTIAVKSKVGEGSTFTLSFNAQCVELSIEDQEAKTQTVDQVLDEDDTQQAPAYLLDKSLKILLAEDNIVNQKVALSMLNKLGYQAELAINGQEAVDMACDGMYDLVILDLQMPVKGGLEAARDIRKLPIEQPYIAAFTANIMKEDRTESFKAGMDDFLSKPIKLKNLSELCEKVEKRLSSGPESESGEMMPTQPGSVQIPGQHHLTDGSLQQP